MNDEPTVEGRDDPRISEQERVAMRAAREPNYRGMLMEDADLAAQQESEDAQE